MTIEFLRLPVRYDRESGCIYENGDLLCIEMHDSRDVEITENGFDRRGEQIAEAINQYADHARLSDEVEALKKERDEMFSRVTEITLKNEIWIQAESGGFVVRGRGLRTIRPTDTRTVTGGDELVFPTVFEAYRALKSEQDREVG